MAGEVRALLVERERKGSLLHWVGILHKGMASGALGNQKGKRTLHVCVALYAAGSSIVIIPYIYLSLLVLPLPSDVSLSIKDSISSCYAVA